MAWWEKLNSKETRGGFQPAFWDSCFPGRIGATRLKLETGILVPTARAASAFDATSDRVDVIAARAVKRGLAALPFETTVVAPIIRKP